MVYLDRRTEEHVFFIKTREHENMFLFRQKNRRTCFFIKTREHENMFLFRQKNMFFIKQENMRTRGEGEGLIEQKENMRFGWALPNTRCLRYPHLNHWIFHSSLFTLH